MKREHLPASTHITSIEGHAFFTSWSGGKDSCLAFHRAVMAGGKPSCLFSMLTEGGERSRSHGLAREVLLAQTSAIGTNIVFRAASWRAYETAFLDGLMEMKDTGASFGVFGDIDGERNLEWVRNVCRTAGIIPHEPLWKAARRDILAEFISAGFKAAIVSVKGELLGPDFLGRFLDMELVRELESLGVDASGENGEYHTVVTDGPVFSVPLALEWKERVFRDGYWFLDAAVSDFHQPKTQ